MKLPNDLKKRVDLPLGTILLVAFFFRFYKLGHESFWCDELHAVIEGDPSLSLHQLFYYLTHADIQPPLFFFIERFIFSIFGRTEITGRLWPALAGVGAVWAMYKLGKEVLNRNLGLIAAAFTCVNYFAIYYAREDRPYSQLFFFAALSLAFFVRFVKSLSRRDMWYYSVFALLTVYTHYFGMILVFSEFCVALILYFTAADKKVYFKRFGLSAVIVTVGFAPWVPFILGVSQYDSHWIAAPGQDFVFNYFDAYFGNSDFLKPVLVVLLLVYLMNVFRNRQQKLVMPGGSPLSLSFVIFSVCLVVTYSLPYIRSVISYPMLVDRYTIVVMPIYLAAAAYGLELIADRWAKVTLFGIFIGWSVLYIFLTNKMYTEIHKTQFREMTEFMVANPRESAYPAINDRINWQEDYYLKRFGFKGTEFSAPRNAVVDSIVHGATSRYSVNGFWLYDAHGAGDPDAFLDSNEKAAVQANFILKEEGRWRDAWARFYLSKKIVPLRLTAADFPPASVIDYEGKVVAIWGGSVSSNTIALAPGSYTMIIKAKGTPVNDEYAHLTIFAGDKQVGDYFTTNVMDSRELPFTQTGDSLRVTIRLDNDFANPKTGEDRNAFVKSIEFIKN